MVLVVVACVVAGIWVVGSALAIAVWRRIDRTAFDSVPD